VWWAEINAEFESGHCAPEFEPGNAFWFGIVGDQLVIEDSTHEIGVPVAAVSAELGFAPVRRPIYMGQLRGQACCAVDLGESMALPKGFSSSHPRTLFGQLEDAQFAIAWRAFHLIQWDRKSQFCGCCATPMEDWDRERAKICPECKHLMFPRISPAVIVAVRRGNRLLLARNKRRPGKMFSIIAGFVEAGETLEDTVRRELHEEVGIEATNIRYFGSQPWPYPDSLMLGFQADYLAGEIQLNDGEIAEANWYLPEDFPQIPSALSISRALIDAFVESCNCPH